MKSHNISLQRFTSHQTILNSIYGLELLNSACEKDWKEMSVLETYANDLSTRKHSPEDHTNNWPIDNFP